MQIVIDIPEEAYKLLKNEGVDWLGAEHILNAVANGTPFPKGHGRIGDLDKIKKEMQDYHDDCAKTSKYTRLGFETAVAVVEDAPTIIEADKGESEVNNG